MELLLLDGVDQASIDNVTMNAEELTELEYRAIDTIEDVIGHLGPDHAAVKALGEDKGAAHMVDGPLGASGAWRVNGPLGTAGRRAQ